MCHSIIDIDSASLPLSLTENVKLIDELTRIPFLYMAGSTKSRVVFISSEGGTFALWSVDPATGNKARLTSEAVTQVADPRHDSDLVYFTRDAAKGAELHKVHVVDAVRGGEKLAVDVHSMRVEGLATSGKVIAFTAATNEDIGLYMSESGQPEKKAKLGGVGVLTDASPNYLVGCGVLAKNPRSMEIFIFKVATGEYTEFTPKAGSMNKAAFIRDSRILFESNITGQNLLHVYDIESGELTLARYSSQDQLAFGPVEHPYYGWTEDGRVWSIGKRDGEARAFVDGKEVPTPAGYLWGLTILGGKVYTSHTTMTQPMKILEIEIGRGNSRVLIDNPLPSRLGERKRRVRAVWYESFDGRRIQAFVIDDGTSTPKRTVMYVHGGPWSDIINTWGVFMNSFSFSGYNVIAPNFRGSTGYGEEFRALDVGDPGGGDLKDLVYATRWAQANGLTTDCAMVGYSYGGYMTLLALGKEPDVWKCGVAGAPVADWREMRELGDAAYRDFCDLLFDHRSELFEERSPKTYAKSVKNPLCITTSQNDSRTPLKPVLSYVTDLQKNGIKFEFHSVADAGHAATATSELMNDLLPAVTFLQKHFPVRP
jgi:dipeptidyl aminopeptidase/acylaminoacyl peptidase